MAVEWQDAFPRSIRFPGGYFCTIRVVSRKYLGGLDGYSIDFEEDKVRLGGKTVKLRRKEARVYIASDLTTVRALHVLYHEILHTYVEWSGRHHEEMLDAIGLEARA